MLQQCAPNVGPVTMMAIIKTESAGHPFILADAGPGNLPWSQRKHLVRTLRPQSAAEAAGMVRDLVNNGHIVAIGLTQVNVRNLPRMGLTVEQVLDPCTNIATGAKILTNFYASALKQLGTTDKQAALQAALSAYWSGDFRRGFDGGYVQQVIKNAGLAVELKVPSLATGTVLRTPAGRMRVEGESVLAAYAAPLDTRNTGTKAGSLQKVSYDPRSSPLAAAGFGPAE
jgi:type IV secretion system protein VirB1